MRPDIRALGYLHGAELNDILWLPPDNLFGVSFENFGEVRGNLDLFREVDRLYVHSDCPTARYEKVWSKLSLVEACLGNSRDGEPCIKDVCQCQGSGFGVLLDPKCPNINEPTSN